LIRLQRSMLKKDFHSLVTISTFGPDCRSELPP
jgi:hypothetical protein